LNNFGAFKTGVAQGIQKICFRQTTGNSAGPQGDVVQGLRRYRPGDQYVTDVKTAAGF
jgi:hypothetical protein